MASTTSVFISAFLAATILPFSSELLLSAVYRVGGGPYFILLLVATTGNVLGSLVNWTLGLHLLHWQNHRMFPFSADQIRAAKVWFQKYGVWTLLMSWVPVIGDPLTLVAGFLRVNIWLFLILVTIGKAGRYTSVMWLTDKII